MDDEALATHAKVGAGKRRALGTEDLATLESIVCIGLVQQRLGKYDEALAV